MMKENSNSFGMPKKTNENSILNSISLNASRDRISELFNDFKKLNIEELNKKTQVGTPSNIKSSPSSSSSVNESKDGPPYNDVRVNRESFVNPVTTDTTETSIPGSANSNANASYVTDTTELLKVRNYTEPKPKPPPSSSIAATTLYVGDLDPSIDDTALRKLFGSYKSLLSVKICYSPTTKKSLGYGYVNFSNELDSKHALADLNYTVVYGKEIRMMPYIKGKNKSFMSTNVFVSNLNVRNLSLRGFYEKFKHVGRILSCKLDLDKKQGFISFEDKDTAIQFVETFNSSVIDGCKVHCSIHIPKSVRQFSQETPRSTNDVLLGIKLQALAMTQGISKINSPPLKKNHTEESLITSIYSPQKKCKEVDSKNSTHVPEAEAHPTRDPLKSLSVTAKLSDKFNQIYVKGLPVNVADQEIYDLFGPHGSISEIYKESVPTYKSSWCLITFKEHKSAVSAIEARHKVTYKGKKLTCVKALKKAERQQKGPSTVEAVFHTPKDISQAVDISNADTVQSQTPTKVYIYNLSKVVNENFFKLFLAQYKLDGKILKIDISKSINENYIEFEKRSDAKIINQKLNGVNIHGLILQTSLNKLENIDPVTDSKCVSTSSNSTTINDDDSTKFTKLYEQEPYHKNFHPIDHQRRQNSHSHSHHTNHLHFIDEPISPPVVGYSIPSGSSYNSSIQSAVPSFPSSSTNMTGICAVGAQPMIKNINGKQYKLIPLPDTSFINEVSIDVNSAYIMSKQLNSPMSYLDFYTTGIEKKSNEKLYTELERVALRHIDFLKYPSATRPRNLKKILKYLIVTLWDNQVEGVKESLSSIEKDPEFTNIFKERLIGAIKLFGFER